MSTTTGHNTHDIVIVDGVPVTEPTTGAITTAVAIESEPGDLVVFNHDLK